MFKHVKVGDRATRNFAGIRQTWDVTKVEDDLITIGMGWTFDVQTGWEVDVDLQWGPEFGRTGSYLVSVESAS